MRILAVLAAVLLLAACNDEPSADAGYDGARLDNRAYRDQQEAYAETSDRLLNHLEAEC